MSQIGNPQSGGAGPTFLLWLADGSSLILLANGTDMLTLAGH